MSNFSFDDLEAQTTDYPETFNFNEPGDEIVGEIEDVRENVGKYSQTVLQVNDGEQSWSVFMNKGIESRFNKIGLEVGDLIGIRMTDETYENSYGTFPVYDVRGKKAE